MNQRKSALPNSIPSYRLPPLNSLRQFEAAGRHLSFRLAAEELNLTPSAVSHGVQTLEEWFDVKLFHRSPRGLDLTDAGTAYLLKIRQALDHLAGATAHMSTSEQGAGLKISVAPGFAARWLVPNLPRFLASHPDIEVSLDTSHRLVQFPKDGMDLAIRMGQGDWPGMYCELLITEDLVPVCSPQVARSIRTVTDLSHQTLLHVTNVSEDWEEWARLAGVARLASDRGLRFDTLETAWSAAARGLGVAIGRLPLVSADLATGRLEMVLGAPVCSQTSYWVIGETANLARPEVSEFLNWLRSEVAAHSGSDASH